MAKAALEMSNPALGEIARLHKNTLNKIDRGEQVKESTLILLRGLLEKRGVIFVEENGGPAGIRFAKPESEHTEEG